MATAWYLILAFLLGGYVVLDGFDLGVGVLYLWAGHSDDERRKMLAAIGPVWDGNEVWLIGFAALLFLAFPKVYAAGFSGFYLPLIIVLWLLMGRGLSIDLRNRLDNPLWRTALDVVFAASSTLLAIVYGIALGNIIHGVPLNPRGYYLGLFSWMLNPYALLVGLLSLVLLTVHGALYLIWRTDGQLQTRLKLIASRLLWILGALLVIATVATFVARPQMADNFGAFVPYVLVPISAAPLLLGAYIFTRRGRDLNAFGCSVLVISALGLATVIGLYPNLLPSRPHPGRSFTIHNAASSMGALFPALIWASAGLVLVVAYTVMVYTIFKGKASVEEGEHY